MSSRLPFVIEGTIQDLLDRKLGYRKESMKIAPFLTKEKLDSIVTSRRDYFERYKYSHEQFQQAGDYELWKFSRRGDAKQDFFALQNPDRQVFLLSKVPSSRFKWRVLTFAWGLYPYLQRVYASSGELHRLLEALQQELGRPLFHGSVVMKRLFGERDTFTDVHFGKQDRPFEEAFRLAASRGSWVDFIQTYDETRKEIVVSLSRKGIVAIRKGRFSAVYDTVLSGMAEESAKQYNFMSNRERSLQPRGQISPFAVEYDEPLFDKPQVMSKLRSVLESYTHCYYTVVHSGNPYLYMMMTDILDNSTFSIQTMRDDRLVIVPQIRTTADSLLRFHRFISTEFREGKLMDLSQVH